MREIKYRQWMGDHFNYWGFGVPEGAVFSGPASLSGRPASDFPQEELTGLKDKNGTEIYEGDILRRPAKDKWEEKNYYSCEVFWHDNDCADNHVGFQMNRTHHYGSVAGTSGSHRFLPGIVAEMEIIGDIHQNPELLK